jgi:predicted nucleotidyltransferase
MNRQIIKEIQTLKRQILPNEKVMLFGSQARGDAQPDSDWDLLVVINKNDSEYTDYQNYGYPFAKIGLNYGAHISTKVFTTKDWEKGRSFPFYKNVMHEGLEIQ